MVRIGELLGADGGLNDVNACEPGQEIQVYISNNAGEPLPENNTITPICINSHESPIIVPRGAHWTSEVEDMYGVMDIDNGQSEPTNYIQLQSTAVIS